MANLFRILGYDVSVRQSIATREVDLVCPRLDVPIPVVYLVECKSGKVTGAVAAGRTGRGRTAGG